MLNLYFFPIPPDVLLAPMVLAKPQKAWSYATLTTVASVVGGVAGYALGFYMFEPWIQPLITDWGKQAVLNKRCLGLMNGGSGLFLLLGFLLFHIKYLR